MIKVNKPKDAPEILAKDGKTETENLCRLYDSGVRKFTINSDIYGHETVKTLLIQIQNQKCVFCESKFTLNSPGDIEHFRPKGGVQQDEKDKRSKTGYYWLAYNWDNLFFSCENCNRSFKRNFFPLENPKDRATSHNDSLSKEKPLIIHPEKEDPEEFISFNKEVPFAIDDNPRGLKTIQHTGLNRLNDKRWEHLVRLAYVYRVATADPKPPNREKALALLEKSKLPESEFSSMVKAAFRSNFFEEFWENMKKE